MCAERKRRKARPPWESVTNYRSLDRAPGLRPSARRTQQAEWNGETLCSCCVQVWALFCEPACRSLGQALGSRLSAWRVRQGGACQVIADLALRLCDNFPSEGEWNGETCSFALPTLSYTSLQFFLDPHARAFFIFEGYIPRSVVFVWHRLKSLIRSPLGQSVLP